MGRYYRGLLGLLLLMLHVEVGQAASICSSEYNPTYSDLGYVITYRDKPLSGCTKYTITEPSKNGSATRACQNSVIPAGFITVDKGNRSDCPYYSMIEYIQDSSPQETVCRDSYIPPNWVVTLTRNGSDCDDEDMMKIENAVDRSYRICGQPNNDGWVSTTGGQGFKIPLGYSIVAKGLNEGDCEPNAYPFSNGAYTDIEKFDGSPMCNIPGQQIPLNYVITSIASNSGCGASGLLTLYDVTRSGFSSTWSLCDLAGRSRIVPDGFIVSDTGTYDNCSVSGTGSGYKLTAVFNGAIVCDKLYLPPNYVITAVDKFTSRCNGNVGYKIHIAEEDLEVCQGSPIPDGWGYTASGMYDACGVGLSDGFGYVIGPIEDGSTVCGSTTVPTGWVILSNTNSSIPCGGAAMTIGLPESSGTTDICFGSVIPEGYVKVMVKTSYSNCTGNGMTIKQPDPVGDTFICADSPIPDGFFVSVERVDYQFCGFYDYGKYISVISGPGPFYVCDLSDIPADYVIVQRGEYGHCTWGYKIELPDPDGSTVCQGSNIPEGYVVVALKTSFSCQSDLYPGGNAYRIQHPNESGPTTICNLGWVDIPAGYLPTGSGNSISCGGYPSIVIIPPNDGQLLPREYINAEPDVVPGNVDPANYDCSGGSTTGFTTTASKNSAQCP